MFEGGGKIVVTGAEGFVGRALVGRLQQLGRAILAPSRRQGFDILSDELDLFGVSHVFHLAARTSVPAAWDDPVGFHLVNAHGAMRVLEQCRMAGCSMTYVSGYVYGAPERLPITERHPVQPNNPYAFSKFMGEEACRFFAAVFGLQVNIVRPFNIYGPEQGERFVIPVIVNQVIDPAVSELVVKDLAPKRDYIHIEDVISAILAVADQPAGAVFNVGSGESVSVAEVVASAFRAAGLTKPVRSAAETRPNEIMDVVADTRAIRALGWRPAISLDKGIEAMVAAARLRLEKSNREPR